MIEYKSWSKTRQILTLCLVIFLLIWLPLLSLLLKVPTLAFYIYYGLCIVVGIVMVYLILRKDKEKKDQPKQKMSITEAVKKTKEELLRTKAYNLTNIQKRTKYSGQPGFTIPILIVKGREYFTQEPLYGFFNSYDPKNYTILTDVKELTEKQEDKLAEELSLHPDKPIITKIEVKDKDTGEVSKTIEKSEPMINTKEQEKEKGGLSK